MTEKKPKKPLYSNYVHYSGLAFQMLALIGLAAWAGISLDRYMGWRFPAFAVILLLLAVVSSIYMVIRNLPRY